MTPLVPLLATWLTLSAAGDRISVLWDVPGDWLHYDTKSGRLLGKEASRTEPAVNGRFRLDRLGGKLEFLDGPASTLALCREPHAAAVTPDGRQLLVACLLPEQAATADHVGARVVVVDLEKRTVRNSMLLPSGSTSARGIAVSPDGRWAFVTHILARYTVHTSQLEQGWMNTNALSVIDVRGGKLRSTVLLDDVDNGAANPWAVAVSGDSRMLYVTHAGTHELSVIEIPAMLERAAAAGGQSADRLSFLAGIRKRVALPGKGPRALAVRGAQVWVAEYFSRTLAQVEGDKARAFAGTPGRAVTAEQRGQLLFHDASLCMQRWQSCSSCHPEGRADGLNWDLLNDGLGNPKNTRSLLNAHHTGVVMWTGVRPSASHAVRTGMKFILFSEPSEQDANAIEGWLKSMLPEKRPGLDKASVERGRMLFFSARTGCAACHPAPLYTDNALHDVSTHAAADFGNALGAGRKPQTEFKTPSLVEVWRTAPYLHDGRYATLEEVLREGNSEDRRGRTSALSLGELRDLVEFLRSL